MIKILLKIVGFVLITISVLLIIASVIEIIATGNYIGIFPIMMFSGICYGGIRLLRKSKTIGSIHKQEKDQLKSKKDHKVKERGSGYQQKEEKEIHYENDHQEPTSRKEFEEIEKQFAQEDIGGTDIVKMLKNYHSENRIVYPRNDVFQELSEKSHQITDKYFLDDVNARTILTKRNRNINFQDILITVTNNFSAFIKVKHHFENRKIKKKTVVFKNQKTSNNLEDMWVHPPKKEFKHYSDKWVRTGSGNIITCDKCNEFGRLICGKCNGERTVKESCPKCYGKGEIERTDKMVGAKKGFGGAVMFRKEQCLNCSGSGKVVVRCSSCSGKGEVICNECNGKGKLYIFEEIRSLSKILKHEIVIKPFNEIPDRVIKKSKVKVSINFKGKVERERVGLNDYENNNKKYGRLYLENIEIKIIPISRISYEYKTKMRELFIINGKPYKKLFGSFK